LQSSAKYAENHALCGDLEYLVYSIGHNKDGDIPKGHGLYSQLKVIVTTGDVEESKSLQLSNYFCDEIKEVDLQILGYILNVPVVFCKEVSQSESWVFTDCRTWNVHEHFWTSVNSREITDFGTKFTRLNRNSFAQSLDTISVVGKFPTFEWNQVIQSLDTMSIVGKFPTLEWNPVIHVYAEKT